MYKKVILVLITFIFISTTVTAQCPASATVVTTESRCKENGTITVTAIPAAAYTYEIIAGPSLSDPTSSNIFTSLPAGNYTVEVSRGGCRITVNATVAGNYIDPGLITLSSVGKIACPGGTACATATQPTNGRLPWKYSIIGGPVLKPAQSSPTFCGLTDGTYSIQAQDSCGVVRTTQFTIGLDTGYLFFQHYSWNTTFANCNDIIVCPITDWYNTSSHSLVKVWWIKPNGDTIKTKGFRTAPTGCDTLVGMGHTYGNWKGVAWDTCGRKWETNFQTSAPSLYVSGFSPTCTGYKVNFGNQWKYSIGVGYTIRKCRDNSIVYSVTQTPPATTFYSPDFNLDYDTCYIFEHYNDCGDTVRYRNFSRANTAKFKINGCGGPGCKIRGTGHLQLYQTYLSGIPPITFTILSGPQGVGTTAVQTASSSWTSLQNMALGTYVIKGEDACGHKDTITVVLNKPLIKSIDVTQTPNCSGGANLRIKITSNYIMCNNSYVTTGYTTGLSTTSPNLGAPVNIIATPVSQTTPGTWQGDFNNVMRDSVRLYYYAYEGCQDDTMIKITQYKPPILSNTVGYVCGPSGIGTLNYNLTGGKPPFKFRVKQDISSTWGAWQDSALFSGMSSGAYDIEVQDGCPNSQIRSATFYSWEKSDFNMSSPCADEDKPFTLTINPPVNYVAYSWYKDNVLVGTGPTYTIPDFDYTYQGKYTARQVFKNAGCIDSTSKWVVQCSLLSLLFGELSGTLKDNKVQLEWNTLRDGMGITFNIERSINGSSFTSIAKVNGNVNKDGSVYSFIDGNPPVSAFYRIRHVSPDGKTGTSNIVRISKMDIVESPLVVTPVPFKYWFTIGIKSTVEEKCDIRLFNIAGSPVYKKSITLKKGNNNVWCDEDKIGLLPAGTYVLEVNTESFNKKLKVIKQ